MTTDGAPQLNDSLVELRCAVAIIRADAVLLLHRRDQGDWVLPGGRPRPHESMGSCARRVAREETGLEVQPIGCAFVIEFNNRETRRRNLKAVFLADEFDTATTLIGAPGRWPLWVSWEDLDAVKLRPHIGGFLRSLSQRDRRYAHYLDNV